MQLYDFQKQIVSNTLDNFYILCGEEIGVMNIYLEKIQISKYRIDEVSESFQSMSRSGKIAQPKCYIVRDDMKYFKDVDNWDKVVSGFKKSKDTLIVIYTKMDKRSKFYKKYQKEMIVFDKLDTNILTKYVMQKIPDFDLKNCKTLIENICENDYSRVMNEADKIECYCKAMAEFEDVSVSASTAFKTLVEEGAIHPSIGDITFQFTDAIIKRSQSQSLELLEKIRLKKESEILILSVLYNSFKQVLMVQGLGSDQSNASKRTGLTPWQVKLAKEKQDYYSISELVDCLKLIQKVEYGIKTGGFPVELSLEYIILNIFGGRI